MIIRELLTKFGIEFDGAGARRADNAISGLASGARALVGVIGGAAMIQGIRSFADGLNQAGSRIHDTALSLGVTNQQLQGLEYAAGQASVGSDTLAVALQTLQRTASNAADGGQEQAQAYRRLGIATRDASGHTKDAATLFTEVGTALGNMTNASDRTRIALQIFGRQGRALIPVFGQGRDSLAAMVAEFHELGGGLSDELVSDADAYGDSIKRLDTAWLGLKSMLGVFVLPALENLIKLVIRGVVGFREMIDGTHVAQLGFYALAAAAVAAGIAMLAPFAETILTIGLVIVIVGGLILVVDDFLTLLDGGQSVIGDFIDSLFGIGSAQHFVEDLREGWKEIAEWISTATNAVENFFGSSHGENTAAPVQEAVRRLRGGNEREGIAAVPSLAERQHASLVQSEAGFQRSSFFGGLQTDAEVTPGIGRTVSAPRTARVPSIQAAGAPQIQTRIQTTAPITVNGAQNPQQVAALVRNAIVEHNEEQLRQAHDILTQGSEE